MAFEFEDFSDDETIADQDEREELGVVITKRHPSLQSKQRQLKLLERLIWEAHDATSEQRISCPDCGQKLRVLPPGTNMAARADAVAKLMKQFREVLADDTEEQLVRAYEQLEELRTLLEQRPMLRQ